MLTKENFTTYVGFQEHKNPAQVALGYLMGYKHKSWIDDIRKMTNDEIIDRLANDNDYPTMSFEITKYATECKWTLDQALEVANSLLRKFPTTDKTIHYAKSRIAFNTRRGAGNAILDDIVLYKGTNNQYDCCLAIVMCGDRCGIVTQPKFHHYGFIVNDGTKI